MNCPTLGRLRTLLATFRIPFLPLTLVCVFLGWSTAYAAGAASVPGTLTLVVLGALCAHVSVNAFNEYYDFKSGIDLHTARTPFSGGSGALPAQPQTARLVLLGAVFASVITMACGVLLMLRAGPSLLPLGLAGLVLVYTYTQWLNRSPLFSLIAAGSGFGIMVLGTHYALTGTIDAKVIIAATVVFFLVNNLLLLNQFPDVDADRHAGRRHLPIVIGRRRSAGILGAFFVATYVAIMAGILVGVLPTAALLGLITAPLAYNVYSGAWHSADDVHALPRYLGRNVLVSLLTPLLIGLGLVFSSSS